MASSKLSASELDAVLHRSGTDHEARPLLVLNACHLPNPKTHDYDWILDHMKLKLDDCVENDYVLILFSAGAVYRPPWTWIYRSYKTLQRKYKKNLKAFYVVHPSMWTRLLLDALKYVVSPKFGRKIVSVQTLSQLAQNVPYRQLTIPQAVLDYNRTLEVTVIVPEPPVTSTTVFGVALEKLMGEQGERGVPLFLTQCIEYIRQHGLQTEGVFRRSPSSVQLKEAKARINEGLDPNITNYDMPVHIACVLIKVFLRDLPTPVFPPPTFPLLETIQQHPDVHQRTPLLHALATSLPASYRRLLQVLLSFLAEVAENESSNRMSASNLAIVVGPNLVRSPDPVADLAVGPAVAGVLCSWISQWREYECDFGVAGVHSKGSVERECAEREPVGVLKEVQVQEMNGRSLLL